MESQVRESLDRIMEETIPGNLNPRLRQHVLLKSELEVFLPISNEAPLLRDKAYECIEVAIDRYMEWLADFESPISNDPSASSDSLMN